MSIRSMISDFLDKTVDGRFKRDGEGRLLFFPWGFGAGRIVPDAATEQRLRAGCRRLTVAIFAVVIPLISGVSGFYQFAGLDFVWFMLGCVAAGFLTQIYPLWLSRDLQRSSERLSYTGAVVQSLDHFGNKFLVFGLATSVLFSVVALAMLALRPFGIASDPIAMTVSAVIFMPMAIVYAMALLKRRRSGGTAT